MDRYTISYYLLLLGILLLVVVIFNMVVKYFKYRGVTSKDISGYDICKMLIDSHKIIGVNIIETRDWFRNIFITNRRVVRLGVKSYYNKDCFNLGVSSFLAGYCIVSDNKNIFIKYLGRVLSKLSYISISSLIVILVSYLFSGYYSFIGIIVLVVLFIYQYFRKCISNEVIHVVSLDIDKLKGINKDIKIGVIDVIKGIDFVYNMGMVITVLQICRLIIYMM